MKLNGILLGIATLAIGLHEIFSKEKHPHTEENTAVELPVSFPANVYNIGGINQYQMYKVDPYAQLATLIG
jgi:hypothetical protein